MAENITARSEIDIELGDLRSEAEGLTGVAMLEQSENISTTARAWLGGNQTGRL